MVLGSVVLGEEVQIVVLGVILAVLVIVVVEVVVEVVLDHPLGVTIMWLVVVEGVVLVAKEMVEILETLELLQIQQLTIVYLFLLGLITQLRQTDL